VCPIVYKALATNLAVSNEECPDFREGVITKQPCRLRAKLEWQQTDPEDLLVS
jgi:hypothetical protein